MGSQNMYNIFATVEIVSILENVTVNIARCAFALRSAWGFRFIR